MHGRICDMARLPQDQRGRPRPGPERGEPEIRGLSAVLSHRPAYGFTMNVASEWASETITSAPALKGGLGTVSTTWIARTVRPL